MYIGKSLIIIDFITFSKCRYSHSHIVTQFWELSATHKWHMTQYSTWFESSAKKIIRKLINELTVKSKVIHTLPLSEICIITSSQRHHIENSMDLLYVKHFLTPPMPSLQQSLTFIQSAHKQTINHLINNNLNF